MMVGVNNEILGEGRERREGTSFLRDDKESPIRLRRAL